jgi:hypothetical protein
VDSTSSSLETDICNHGYSVYVVPIVVEVFSMLPFADAYGKSPAYPNFLSIYGLKYLRRIMKLRIPKKRYRTHYIKQIEEAIRKE